MFSVILGVGIVMPLLPVFAQDLGANGFLIGLLFGSFSLSRTFFLPFFGRMSDINGRKPFILIGLFSYAIISIVFMYIYDPILLIVCRFFQGIASAMIMPVVQAYIGEMTPKGQEGFQMASFNISIFASLSLGPILGGYINDQWNLQAAFMVMGILAFVSFLAALILLPPTSEERYRQKRTPNIPWTKVLNHKSLVGLFAFRLTYTTSIGMIWAFLPVYATNEFQLSSSEIGILLMLSVFVSGLLQIPMGYLADRISRNLLIITGTIFVCLSIFGFKYSEGFWSLFMISCLHGIGGGFANPAVMASSIIIGKKKKMMGSVVSFLTIGHSLGMLLGSLIAGIIMDISNILSAFYIGGWMMIFGLFVFLWSIVPGNKSVR